MSVQIRIATRKSPLALWQANFVKQGLVKLHKDITISFVELVTHGDRELSQALTDIGGKSLFVR